MFNRKYKKAVEEIEMRIEYCRGREDYYRSCLKLTDNICEMKFYADKIEEYMTQSIMLKSMLRNIKHR